VSDALFDDFAQQLASAQRRKSLRDVGFSRDEAAWMTAREEALVRGANLRKWVRDNPPPVTGKQDGIEVTFKRAPRTDQGMIDAASRAAAVSPDPKLYGAPVRDPSGGPRESMDVWDGEGRVTTTGMRQNRGILSWTDRDRGLGDNPQRVESSPEIGDPSKKAPWLNWGTPDDPRPYNLDFQSKTPPVSESLDRLSKGAQLANRGPNAARAAKLQLTIDALEASLLNRDPESGEWYDFSTGGRGKPRLEDPARVKWGKVGPEFQQLRSADEGKTAWMLRRYQIESGLTMQKAAAYKLRVGDPNDVELLLRKGRAAVAGTEDFTTLMARLAANSPGKYNKVMKALGTVGASGGAEEALLGVAKVAGSVIKAL